ncbi:MAG: adenylosuccinate synthase [Mesorhizobium amorphae]|nr:MAG: adenylosuccinate synthase [Mesorhizobium amorphae]
MSIRAQAVIGAGYGDEGKGLVTDALAARNGATVVVRSNGGAQAGHTVERPDGGRHVFHHVGAGALAGASTQLSRFFVAHPMLFAAEWEELRMLGACLDIRADPRGPVSTPFDMIVNQAIEIERGAGRHGSCGLGFGETVERSLHADFALTIGDLFRADLASRLARVRDAWVPARLAALGIERLPEPLADALGSQTTLRRFLDDCESYRDRVTPWPDRRLAERGAVLFEGAQGLLLDQEWGAFPHVTRSHTGLRNMLAIAREAGIGEIDARYVSRVYATRHGAGPLPGEAPRLAGIAVSDPTNQPNEWQGTLRLAPLDTALLRAAIARDRALASLSGVAVAPSLVVTCLDQVTGPFTIQTEAAPETLDATSAAEAIADRLGLPLAGESWGARRDALRWRDTASAA